jgi:hypothetical protein
MSIATLKRKTQTQYNNMSVGQKGFSLNGSFRGQGYVGQSTQSRTLVRSLAKGATLRGHGGYSGLYPVTTVKSSELLHLDDSSVARNSVINTNGMLLSKYRWVRRPQPYSTFKMSDSNAQVNSQSTYIDNLVKNALNAMELPTHWCWFFPNYCSYIQTGERRRGNGRYRTIGEVTSVEFCLRNHR